MGNTLECCRRPSVKDDDAAAEAKAGGGGAGDKDEDPPILPHGPPSLVRRPVLGAELTTDVTAKFELSRIIGRGAFGTTRLCTERGSGRQYACKSILKQRVQGEAGGGGGGGGGGDGPNGVDVRRELDIMLHLAGHPNIVQVVDAFEDNTYVHIVMEYCSGGDLVARLMKKGAYTERDAAAIIRALLEVLAYSHDMGCAHLDIKPDNCLMADESEGAPAKVADWGYAQFVRSRRSLKGIVGTSFYVAPEVLSGDGYDERADMWSAGAMLYVLLAGRPPFFAVRDEDVLRKVLDDGVPDLSAAPWPSISAPAKEAVSLMMTYDPDMRPTAREVLRHPWVVEGGVAGDNLIQPEVLHRLRSFAAMNVFKQQAALIIAGHLPYDEVRGLRELFEAMDADGDGSVSPQELKKALEQRGGALPPGELERLFALADENGDGRLDYAEFLASTLHHARLEEEENLAYAFKTFDRDGNGFISAAELSAALAAMGRPHRRASEVMAEVDKDGDGGVDFYEFVILMTGDASRLDGAPRHGGITALMAPPAAAAAAAGAAPAAAAVAAAAAAAARQASQGDEAAGGSASASGGAPGGAAAGEAGAAAPAGPEGGGTAPAGAVYAIAFRPFVRGRAETYARRLQHAAPDSEGSKTYLPEPSSIKNASVLWTAAGGGAPAPAAAGAPPSAGSPSGSSAPPPAAAPAAAAAAISAARVDLPEPGRPRMIHAVRSGARAPPSAARAARKAAASALPGGGSSQQPSRRTHGGGPPRAGLPPPPAKRPPKARPPPFRNPPPPAPSAPAPGAPPRGAGAQRAAPEPAAGAAPAPAAGGAAPQPDAWREQVDFGLPQPDTPMQGIQMLRTYVAHKLAQREREAAAAASGRRGGPPPAPAHIWIEEVVPGFQQSTGRRLDPSFFKHASLLALLAATLAKDNAAIATARGAGGQAGRVAIVRPADGAPAIGEPRRRLAGLHGPGPAAEGAAEGAEGGGAGAVVTDTKPAPYMLTPGGRGGGGGRGFGAPSWRAASSGGGGSGGGGGGGSGGGGGGGDGFDDGGGGAAKRRRSEPSPFEGAEAPRAAPAAAKPAGWKPLEYPVAQRGATAVAAAPAPVGSVSAQQLQQLAQAVQMVAQHAPPASGSGGGGGYGGAGAAAVRAGAARAGAAGGGAAGAARAAAVCGGAARRAAARAGAARGLAARRARAAPAAAAGARALVSDVGGAARRAADVRAAAAALACRASP
ncbi:MAG: hypothetical protein J3K34DRAFT_458027 [Monoraphidium minutum]|nr:MAG: hypothetical protein J3K34DRAFT_458027 [Monoraphidium minutum]